VDCGILCYVTSFLLLLAHLALCLFWILGSSNRCVYVCVCVYVCACACVRRCVHASLLH